MNSIKELRTSNEMISRELADACRQVVDMTYAYNSLHKLYMDQQKAFVKFVMKEGRSDSEITALEKVQWLTEHVNDPEQLELPLK